MKHFIKLVVSLLFLQLAFQEVNAWVEEKTADGKVLIKRTGGISGGGGKSIVCRNEQKEIVSAQLLDFFEAKPVYEYSIAESSEDVFTQAKARLIQIGKGGESSLWADELLRLGEYININKRVLSDEYALAPTEDSLHNIELHGCEVEQLAIYDDEEDLVLIDGTIWAKLSNTHKAGLLVHETVYKLLRQWGDTNSKWARKGIAFAFSGGQFESVTSGIPQNAYECFHSTSSGPPYGYGYGWPGQIQGDLLNRFFIYKSLSGTWIFQFVRLNGKTFLTKSTWEWPGTGDFDGGTFKAWTDSKLHRIRFWGDLNTMQYQPPESTQLFRDLVGNIGLGITAEISDATRVYCKDPNNNVGPL